MIFIQTGEMMILHYLKITLLGLILSTQISPVLTTQLWLWIGFVLAVDALLRYQFPSYRKD